MNQFQIPRPHEAEVLDNKNQRENTALHTKRDDKASNRNVGLYENDEAIMYYLTNIVLPRCQENGKVINVPIIYGSPEKWKSIQQDGFMRDNRNKLMVPVITYKRTNTVKNRGKGRILDPQNPLIFRTFIGKYTERNNYDQFSVLTNAKPQKEIYNVFIPDYLTITYEGVIWTDYITQMNKIIEAISYSESSYWGNDRFKFYVVINSFSGTTEVIDGEDRAVKTNFEMSLNGFIIPDAIQKEIAEKSQKSFTLSRVQLSFNINENIWDIPAGGLSTEDILHSDLIISNNYNYSDQILEYLNTDLTKRADTVLSTSAVFIGSRFARAPWPLPSTGIDDFSLYLNGQFMLPRGFTISESGNDIYVTFDPDTIDYIINPSTDVIELRGKFAH